jgi:hemolysin III
MMKRPKIPQIIRRYTFGEEVGNSVSHGTMAFITLGGIAPASITVFNRSGSLAAVGMSIFVCSLFLMFLFSALYHSMVFDTRHKHYLQILDHIFIYVAIAGTYTPIALAVIGGWPGIVVASLQWAMVLFGVLYKSLSRQSIPKVSVTIYLVMGWSVVAVLPLFLANAPLALQLLILGGGVFYSAGTFFYRKKEIRFFHMVWHFFVNLGAVCHFVGILMYL